MRLKESYFICLLLFTLPFYAQNFDVQLTTEKIKKTEDFLFKNNYFNKDTIALKNYLEPLAKNKSEEIIYDIQLADGYSSFFEKENPQSKNLYLKTIKKASDFKYPALEIWSQLSYVFYLYHYRNYPKMTPLLLDLIEDVKRLEANQMLFPGVTYKKIGWILQTLGDNNEALHFLQLAKQSTPTASSEYASILDAIGVNYYDKNDLEKATLYFNKVAKLSKEINDEIRYGKAIGNLALVLQKKGEFSSAILLMEKDIAISERLKNDQNTMFALIKLGNLYLETNQFNKADVVLQKAKKIATSKKYFEKSELETIKLQLKILEQNPSPANELALRKRMNTLEDVLKDKDGDTAILNSNWLVEKTKFQKNIDLSNAKLQEEALLKNGFALLATAVIVITVLLYLNSKKQLKNRELRYHQKVITLELEKLKTEQKLTEVQNNLGSQIAYLRDKNLKIKNLKTEINNIKATSSHYLEKKNGKLNSLLESHLMTESNWSAFKKEYQKEYPDFFNLLQKEFPEITDSNLRILLLQKLNFTTSEIAELLGITTEAIKKSKQRLKKKLGPKSDLLLEYLELKTP